MALTTDENMSDWDAAYVLGALTPGERLEYEQFIAAEPGRTAAVSELADLPAILDVLPRELALAMLDDDTNATPNAHLGDSTPPPVVDLRDKLARRPQWRAALAAAAAFLLLGGIVGYAVVPRQATRDTHLDAMDQGQRPGVTAALAVTPEEWGTRLDWECNYTEPWARSVPSYDLVVTTKSGTQATVASWRPSGQVSQASNLAAATTIPLSQIHSVDIRITGTATPLAVTNFA